MAAPLGTSGHIGGALGIFGLVAVLAGCTYLQFQHPGATVPDAEPGTQSAGFLPWRLVRAPTPQASEPLAEDTAIADAPVAPEPVPASQTIHTSVDPVAPTPTPPPVVQAAQSAIVTPSPRPEIAAVQTERGRPAQAESARASRRADFIVKFSGEPEIDQVIANWRSDRPRAEAIFNDWAAGHDLFAGMELAGCSYSGELILSAHVQSGLQGAERSVDGLLARIRDHGSVAYADPDFTAHPGLAQE